MRNLLQAQALIIAFCSFASLAAAQQPGMPHSSSSLEMKLDKKSLVPTRSRWGVGISAPELLFVQYQRDLSPRNYFGAAFGYLPVMLASEQLREPQEKAMNDKFNVVLSPKAHAASVSLFHGYRFTRRFAFETRAALLLINAGGSAFIKSRESGESTSIADIEMTVYVPTLSLNLVYSVYKASSWSFDVGGGVSTILARSIQSQVSGKLPSFLDVAPEYRTSIVDGRKEIEQDLNDAIDRLPFQKTFLPTLFVRGTW